MDNYIIIQDGNLDRQYEEFVLDALRNNRQGRIISQEEFFAKHSKEG